MRRTLFTLLALALSAASWAAKENTCVVTSPDGTVKVTAASSASGMTWAVEQDGVTVLMPSKIDITIDGARQMTAAGKTSARKSVDQKTNVIYARRSVIHELYNSATVRINSLVSVEIRAYNNIAAYRIIANAGKQKTVDNECAEFRFAGDYQAYVPYVNDSRGERWCYSFESYYDEQKLSGMFADSLAISPLAVCLPGGRKAVVMDAGVENYPGMMLLKGDGNCLKAAFAPCAEEQKVGGFSELNLMPTKRAAYIARIQGRQELPWRAVVMTRSDKELLDCDAAMQLAPACRIADPSWIRPGKVAWDWWNNTNITGVDFKSGMNTPTYKFYIDFAQKNGLEYIIIDEGWSSKESLMEGLNKEIDIPALIAYGKERGVGVILWSSWRNLIANDPENGCGYAEKVMKHYAEMGIKGFKVDFFDRDDQVVIASAYKLAEIAAKHRLLLDYHGLKPFGVQRAYPNVVNFEGVKGLENSKWEPRVGDGPLHDQPRYDVLCPYLRMLAGPMDYTPGAMDNARRDNFFGNNDHPMSQGTRVHQMAMYATFEAPLQMLADSPTKYMREQECTDFIAKVPTMFDETVVLGGELGEYTLVARRKGKAWYVAALTNWTARDLVVDFSFLGDGEFTADIFADGVNAEKEATDYRHSSAKVSKTTKLTARLASGGGWTAIVR